MIAKEVVGKFPLLASAESRSGTSATTKRIITCSGKLCARKDIALRHTVLFFF